MSALTIEPVTDRARLRRFVRLPRILYRHCAGFVPSLDIERRDMLDPKKGPFFGHGRAQYFIAHRNGEPLGRISAQIDTLAEDTAVGLFGCLDVADDQEATATLLDTAARWLRQEGMRTMRGPFLLSINGESGLQIEGQHLRSMIMTPWHPPYLQRHVEWAGARKARDLVSYTLAVGTENAVAVRMRRAARAASTPAGMNGLTVRRMRDDLEAEGDVIHALFNDAWKDNWGYIPLSRVELRHSIKELKPLLHPDYLVVVERDGQPVAFALVLPNLFDIVGDLNGTLGIIGASRLAWRVWRRTFESAHVILLGIQSQLQGTTTGGLVSAILMGEVIRRGDNLPFREVELGWVLEDNSRMRRLIESLGFTVTKRHRLYEMAL